MKLLGDRIYRLGEAELILSSRSIAVAGKPQQLRAQAFDTLIYLIANRQRLVTKEELVQAVWQGVSVSDNSLSQCIADLRRALGDNAREPRFIRTITKGGYQFIGPVEEIVVGGTLRPHSGTVTLEQVTTVHVEVEEQEQQSLLRPASAPIGKPVAWISAAAIAIALLATAIVWRIGGSPEPNTTLPRVAGNRPVLVLYFENQSHTPDLDWLRDGLADMVITDLSRFPRVNVLSRQQVQTLFDRTGHPTSLDLRLRDALQIAQRARAQVLLLGSFAKLGDKTRITVQVHRADDGSLIKTELATADQPGQIISQMGLLTAKLARDLGVGLPRNNVPPLPVTNNLEAYRYYSLGMEKLAGVHAQEAIPLLERAVALDADFAAAFAQLGNAYTISSGRPALGKPYYQKAFRLSQRLTDKDRLYLTGWYALADSDYQEAIRIFQRIVAAYPDDALAYKRLGRLLEGEARYAEALQAFQQGLIADPDEPSLYNVMTQVYCRLGFFDDGLTAARRYIELSKEEPNSYDTLGTLYACFGKYSEAEQAYRTALHRKPDFRIAQAHLAVVHYWSGRYRAAVAELSSIHDDIRVAWILRKRGEIDQAHKAAEREMRSTPYLSVTAVMLALDRGDIGAAKKIVEPFAGVNSSALGSRGSNRPYFYALGQIALQEQRNSEAIALFKRCVAETEPIGYVEWYDDALGDGYLSLGRFNEAIAEYQKVLARNPSHAMARYHLAVAYGRQGDRRESQAAYRKLLEIWKDADPDVRELREAKAALAPGTSKLPTGSP